MNVLCNRILASWLLALAYVALIAHVFIPHHHHGEHTAFLDFKSCPHEQHEQHDHTGHQHQGNADNASHTPFGTVGECETLKYVWIQDQQISIPDADLPGVFLLPDFELIGLHLALPLSGPLGIKHRHSDSGSYTSYITLSQGLRAPPVSA